MGYFRHIEKANNANFENYRPFFWRDQRIGWIRLDRLEVLRAWASHFSIEEGRVLFTPKEDSYEGRSQALSEVTSALREQGEILQWWDEPYALTRHFGGEAIAEIERGACPYFGLRSWGVHMNGYVRKEDGLYMWVAKRSMEKQNDPGKLDNMVAGGQPKGLSLKENMQKECMEEAGIPEALSDNLRAAGIISYNHEQRHGLKPDQIFVFDLEIPESFKPVEVDGEVESFSLLPVEEVKRIIRETDEMKYNCNLVYMDFFIRHGYLNADEEPDYVAIAEGLKGILP